MSVQFGKIRTVDEHKLYTVSGKPIYWQPLLRMSLEKCSDSARQVSTIDPITSQLNQKYLAKAVAQFGEPCEWRFARKTEVSSVSF